MTGRWFTLWIVLAILAAWLAADPEGFGNFWLSFGDGLGGLLK